MSGIMFGCAAINLALFVYNLRKGRAVLTLFCAGACMVCVLAAVTP